MHSVTESANTSIREQKRWETSQRITACAQRLTDQHGLDGFTMDDLAAAAEVSRRTLFNYFPSKVDAVLGEHPEISPSVLAEFHGGGPHGDLVEDLAELARAVLAVKQPDRVHVELVRRLMATNPRLLLAAHERFEAITEEFTALVVEREGAGFGTARARLLLRLLLALFDAALVELLQEGETRPLDELFEAQLSATRELFAT
jgi:AcrR family transcriptional regulator